VPFNFRVLSFQRALFHPCLGSRVFSGTPSFFFPLRNTATFAPPSCHFLGYLHWVFSTYTPMDPGSSPDLINPPFPLGTLRNKFYFPWFFFYLWYSGPFVFFFYPPRGWAVTKQNFPFSPPPFLFFLSTLRGFLFGPGRCGVVCTNTNTEFNPPPHTPLSDVFTSPLPRGTKRVSLNLFSGLLGRLIRCVRHSLFDLLAFGSSGVFFFYVSWAPSHSETFLLWHVLTPSQTPFKSCLFSGFLVSVTAVSWVLQKDVHQKIFLLFFFFFLTPDFFGRFVLEKKNNLLKKTMSPTRECGIGVVGWGVQPPLFVLLGRRTGAGFTMGKTMDTKNPNLLTGPPLFFEIHRRVVEVPRQIPLNFIGRNHASGPPFLDCLHSLGKLICG